MVISELFSLKSGDFWSILFTKDFFSPKYTFYEIFLGRSYFVVITHPINENEVATFFCFWGIFAYNVSRSLFFML
jgi:hypothetical protein